MRILMTVLIMISAQFAVFAQDVGFKLKQTNQGFSYESFPFPDNVMVFSLETGKHILKPKGLTLIRVWSMKDGVRSGLWNRAREIENTYKAQGLTTYSINFENGSDFRRQKRELEAFFKNVNKPEHFYFDPMGYTVDLLKVPGFPSFFLVDPKGQVVFKTLAEDESGVDLLEQEIQNYLNPKK